MRRKNSLLLQVMNQKRRQMTILIPMNNQKKVKIMMTMEIMMKKRRLRSIKVEIKDLDRLR